MTIKLGDIVKRTRPISDAKGEDFVLQVINVTEDREGKKFYGMVTKSASERFTVGATYYMGNGSLYEVIDEPLPEVNDSLFIFLRGTSARITKSKTYPGAVQITTQANADNPWTMPVYLDMHPDDALDFAHDIIRMAMEVKREQKHS